MRVAALGLVVAVWLALLRGKVPEYGALMAVAFVTVALGAVLPALSEAVRVLGRLSELAGPSGAHLQVVLRAVAIAYVAGIGAQLCRDAGQESIAVAVELAGKVAIVTVAMPIFVALLDSLWRLLPGN